jgi:hypothetical protein
MHVLQKRKAGPVDAYKLTLRALETYQVRLCQRGEIYGKRMHRIAFGSLTGLNGVCVHLQGASAAELIAVKKTAAEAVADFIRFPDVYQFDLLETEAVSQLKKDVEHGPLYRLLNILLKSTSVKVC